VNKKNPENSIVLVMPSNAAIVVAHVILNKATDVEYEIADAVERLTRFE
jgi:hypothetical protein